MNYLLISTVLFAGGIFIIAWIHNQYHLDVVVRPAMPPKQAPLISVCIPARDEERNIRHSVESVLAQDYPNLEVIVLDDRSRDGTHAILLELAATDNRLALLSGSDLPPGWVGKPHALQQAAASSRGEWLCFVDADTFLSPDAISSCYAKAVETNADMFSIMTFQILGSFWEKVVMPLVMTALSVGFSPRKVNDPHRRDAIANGQFILIKRSVYHEVGGYAGVKDRIVEDKAIAEQVKWKGFRLVVADGRQAASTRMYTSLREIWQGWTKNIFPGLRDRPSLLWLGVFGAFLAMIAAFFLPLWPLLGYFWLIMHGGGLPAAGVILQSLVVLGFLLSVRVRVAIRMKISPWYALSTPLGAAIFGGMMAASAWKVVTHKGVVWKGRTYQPV